MLTWCVRVAAAVAVMSFLAGCGKSEEEERAESVAKVMEQVQRQAAEAEKIHQQQMKRHEEEMAAQMAEMEAEKRQRQREREEMERRLAEYQRAIDFYNEGNLDKAKALLLPLAEAGDEDSKRVLDEIRRKQESQAKHEAMEREKLERAGREKAEHDRVMSLPSLETSKQISDLFRGVTITYQYGVGKSKQRVMYIGQGEDYVGFSKAGVTWFDESSWSYESQVDRGIYRIEDNKICLHGRMGEVCYLVKPDSGGMYYLVPTNKVRISPYSDSEKVTPKLMKISGIARGNVYKFKMRGANLVLE